MVSSKIRKILSAEGPREAKNELAAFFRRILRDLNVDARKWATLLDEYLAKYDTQSTANSKDRSYAKGNLNTQLTNDSLTWRTFMDGIRLLNPLEVKIVLHLGWGFGRTTQHTLNMRIRHAPSPISVLDEVSAVPFDIPGGAKPPETPEETPPMSTDKNSEASDE